MRNYGNFFDRYKKDYDLNIEVQKKFDTEIKTEVDTDFQIKVDVYKDIDVWLDISTDVDLEGNSAVGTGRAENDAPTKWLVDISGPTASPQVVLTYTDDWTSKSQVEAAVVDLDSLYPSTTVNIGSKAWGDKTYTELDFTLDVTQHAHVVTWHSESATD